MKTSTARAEPFAVPRRNRNSLFVMNEEIALEDLPYDELKRRALHVARENHDIGFILDLLTHTPAARAAADEGGSLGDFTGTVAEMVAAAEEVFGGESVGDSEPLFRARFVTYIREHEEE